MLRGNHKKQNFAQAAFQSCLLFLLVFFGAAPFSAQANTSKLHGRNYVDAKQVLPADFWLNTDFSAERPYDPNSAPEEPESHSQADQENFDDDDKLNFWIHSSEYLLSFSVSVKNHFYRSAQAYQNQASLPLYILFHSWKSYLL